MISRRNLAESLKEGGRGASGSVHTNRIRSLLVVAEIALALVLLVGAGLLIQSLVRLQQVPVGFDPRNILTFSVAKSVDSTTEPSQIAEFYRQLIERMKALPGVINASVVFQLPLGGSGGSTGLLIEGHQDEPANPPFAVIHSVSPDYFRTMGIQIITGREFTEHDDSNSPPVLIINEALARRYLPNENPIGKRIRPGFSTIPVDDESGRREVVGVVADVRHHNLEDSPQPEIYFAQAQMPLSTMTVVAHTSSDPRALTDAAREVVKSLDKNAPVYSIRTAAELLGQSAASPRFNTLLLGLFASVALILTAVGLFGLISCSVTQSTHEIGVRVALGAQRSDILKLVVGHGLVLTIVGLALGLTGAYALSRLLKSLLFGVSATDPLTYVVVSLLLLLTTLVACYLPARRATKVDPTVALRYE